MTRLTLNHCEGTANVQLVWYYYSGSAFLGEGPTITPI